MITALGACSAVVAHAELLTAATITGSWQLKTACMKGGACIEFKPDSMRLFFVADGSWKAVAKDKTGTTMSGTYIVKEGRLVLKLADGGTYQDWNPVLQSNGQSFVVTDKQLIETFVRESAKPE